MHVWTKSRWFLKKKRKKKNVVKSTILSGCLSWVRPWLFHCYSVTHCFSFCFFLFQLAFGLVPLLVCWTQSLARESPFLFSSALHQVCCGILTFIGIVLDIARRIQFQPTFGVLFPLPTWTDEAGSECLQPSGPYSRYSFEIFQVFDDANGDLTSPAAYG